MLLKLFFAVWLSTAQFFDFGPWIEGFVFCLRAFRGWKKHVADLESILDLASELLATVQGQVCSSGL